MDELETLYQPKVIDVVVRGGTVSVAPLTVGQIPAFARALRPLVPALQGGAADWLGLIADHGEAVIEACSIATEMKHEDLGGLPPDEFFALAEAVIEVNMDFFTRRLTRAVEQAADRIVKIAGTGLTPSKP